MSPHHPSNPKPTPPSKPNIKSKIISQLCQKSGSTLSQIFHDGAQGEMIVPTTASEGAQTIPLPQGMVSTQPRNTAQGHEERAMPEPSSDASSPREAMSEETTSQGFFGKVFNRCQQFFKSGKKGREERRIVTADQVMTRFFPVTFARQKGMVKKADGKATQRKLKTGNAKKGDSTKADVPSPVKKDGSPQEQLTPQADAIRPPSTSTLPAEPPAETEIIPRDIFLPLEEGTGLRHVFPWMNTEAPTTMAIEAIVIPEELGTGLSHVFPRINKEAPAPTAADGIVIPEEQGLGLSHVFPFLGRSKDDEKDIIYYPEDTIGDLASTHSPAQDEITIPEEQGSGLGHVFPFMGQGENNDIVTYPEIPAATDAGEFPPTQIVIPEEEGTGLAHVFPFLTQNEQDFIVTYPEVRSTAQEEESALEQTLIPEEEGSGLSHVFPWMSGIQDEGEDFTSEDEIALTSDTAHKPAEICLPVEQVVPSSLSPSSASNVIPNETSEDMPDSGSPNSNSQENSEEASSDRPEESSADSSLAVTNQHDIDPSKDLAVEGSGDDEYSSAGKIPMPDLNQEKATLLKKLRAANERINYLQEKDLRKENSFLTRRMKAAEAHIKDSEERLRAEEEENEENDDLIEKLQNEQEEIHATLSRQTLEIQNKSSALSTVKAHNEHLEQVNGELSRRMREARATNELVDRNAVLHKNIEAFQQKTDGLREELKTAEAERRRLEGAVEVANGKIDVRDGWLRAHNVQHEKNVAIFMKTAGELKATAAHVKILEAALRGEYDNGAQVSQMIGALRQRVSILEQELKGRVVNDERLGRMWATFASVYNDLAKVANEQQNLGICLVHHLLHLEGVLQQHGMNVKPTERDWVLSEAESLLGTAPKGDITTEEDSDGNTVKAVEFALVIENADALLNIILKSDEKDEREVEEGEDAEEEEIAEEEDGKTDGEDQVDEEVAGEDVGADVEAEVVIDATATDPQSRPDERDELIEDFEGGLQAGSPASIDVDLGISSDDEGDEHFFDNTSLDDVQEDPQTEEENSLFIAHPSEDEDSYFPPMDTFWGTPAYEAATAESAPSPQSTKPKPAPGSPGTERARAFVLTIPNSAHRALRAAKTSAASSASAATASPPVADTPRSGDPTPASTPNADPQAAKKKNKRQKLTSRQRTQKRKEMRARVKAVGRSSES